MAAAKSKGLKGLIGKQVMMKLYVDKPDDKPSGPFLVVDVENPMLRLKHGSKVFWWNLKDIEGIIEYEEVVVETK